MFADWLEVMVSVIVVYKIGVGDTIGHSSQLDNFTYATGLGWSKYSYWYQ